jgi:ribosomal protein L18E
MRTFTYRVYFTVSPTTYYVVAARNAKAAVWRARRVQRALRLNKRRTAPLQVARVERLYRHGAGVRRVQP